MIRKHVLMISTGQHVGKTTTSLGLVQVLQDKFKAKKKEGILAYCKPVGQQHVDVGNGLRVDKDSYLFKDYFGLVQDYQAMSPVIFPEGFTRDYIDGKVSSQELLTKIKTAHSKLMNESDFLVCEGTGHTGVGSICQVNNAQVAAALNMDVIIVTLGGLGSSFDQLAMNHAMLEKHGVNIRGVIMNKVDPTKLERTRDYFSRALERWNIPLIGCIPQLDALSHASMQDFSKLLKADIISGFDARLRYFNNIRLAVAPVDERNVFKPIPHQLSITHSNRGDVVDAIISNQRKFRSMGDNLLPGLILTGWDPPSSELKRKLEEENIPCIYVSPKTADSYTIVARIANFTAKQNRADEPRIKLAIDHVSKHVNFDLIDI